MLSYWQKRAAAATALTGWALYRNFFLAPKKIVRDHEMVSCNSLNFGLFSVAEIWEDGYWQCFGYKIYSLRRIEFVEPAAKEKLPEQQSG